MEDDSIPQASQGGHSWNPALRRHNSVQDVPLAEAHLDHDSQPFDHHAADLTPAQPDTTEAPISDSQSPPLEPLEEQAPPALESAPEPSPALDSIQEQAPPASEPELHQEQAPPALETTQEQPTPASAADLVQEQALPALETIQEQPTSAPEPELHQEQAPPASEPFQEQAPPAETPALIPEPTSHSAEKISSEDNEPTEVAAPENNQPTEAPVSENQPTETIAPENHEPTEAPTPDDQPKETPIPDDEPPTEAAIPENEPIKVPDDQAIEAAFPESGQSKETAFPEIDEPTEAVLPETEQDMGDNYEYQGESTAADDAIEESDNAPLLQDQEDMPTPGLATDAPATYAADVAQETGHDDPSALSQPEQNQETAPEADVESAATASAPEPVESTQEIIQKVAEHPIEQQTQSGLREGLLSPIKIQSQSSAAFEWPDDETTDDFGAVIGFTPDRNQGNRVSSDNHAAGSGIAASRSTAIAQVLQEQEHDSQVLQQQENDSRALQEQEHDSQVPQEQETNKGDNKEQDKKEEGDLAAMWAAMSLDDDDFLDENQVDPSGFFADDDEGFLEDFNPQAEQQLSPGNNVLSPVIAAVVDSQGKTTGFTTLGGPQAQIKAPANRYAPQAQSQQTNPYQPLAGTATSSPYAQTPFQQPQQQQPPQRPALNSAQSFVDKSKGGYSSPYDLPEDIVQPRRRPAPPVASKTTGPLPPPRSSSMVSATAPPTAPPPLSRSSTAASFATATLPASTQHAAAQSASSKPPSAAAGTLARSASGFFEELPLVPKPKVRPSGAYTPVVTSPSPPIGFPQAPPATVNAPPLAPPSRPLSRPVMPPPVGSTSQVLGGLRQPDRLPLLPETTPTFQQLEPPQTTGPAAASRYSPAPVPLPSATAPPPATGRFSPMPPPAPPAAASRYSPAPPSHAPVQTQAQAQAQAKYAAVPATPAARPVQPFAPRTSSPLAYQEKPASTEPAPPVRPISYQPSPPARQMSGLADGMQTPARQNSMDQHAQPGNFYGSPPRTNAYAPLNASPDSRRSHAFSPMDARTPRDQVSPPRRPRTQSPGAVMKGPLRTLTQIDRPTSAAGNVTSPTIQRQDARASLLPPRNQFSSDLNFAVPQDERAADPLERYKGCPIFKWGPSGQLISTFPKQAPFYAAGHAIPTIKCTPGFVTIHDTKAAFPLDDRDAKFPGPLKGKAKKKDVLSWISGKIEDLERVHEGALLDLGMPTLMKRRVEEKVILWKMVKLLLEHDNKIEGNAAAEDAARKILLPNLAQTEASAEEVPGNTTSALTSEPVSAQAVAKIRQHLLQGEREKAVWYAAEQRLWSHALLIASVAGPEIWKQVVQEFVRAQVKDAGENSQSLAALYEVFAGNWDESIDELVPPSARAGFQMISKAGPSAKNPLDGLDQWRETLGLIISNRSNNDYQAIAALGKLLSSYGRSEAAHTCFLFAKASVQLGGVDDPKSDFVLLGADHKNQPQELAIDLDAILLTEIYELTVSLTPVPGSSTAVHHLQAYKFQHAQILAEHGLRSEAQAYCDAIASASKASTRASPYYHSALLSSVEDLSRCMSQAPQTSSSGWIPKPSMDKVSGSMWKRFNTFVAGDDDDQKSTGSAGADGPAAAGPFGKITGDTPTVSRSASVTDLYSAMAMNGGVAPAALGTSAPSKYAPLQSGGASAARYAPNTYAPGRTSIDSSRSYEPERPGSGYTAASSLQSPTTAMAVPPQRASSTPFGAYMPHVAEAQQAPQSLGVPRPEASRAVSDYRVHYSQPPSRRESFQSGGASEPRSSLDQGRPAFGYQPESVQQSPYQHSSYTPMAPIYGGNNPEEAESEEPKSYEPSAYQPYQPSEMTPIKEPEVSSYEPSAPSYDAPTSSYEPTKSSYEPPATSYEPPASSYEPPETPSGYEPPGDNSTYQPYQPDPDPEQDEQAPPQPKKKGIMDDDDDDFEARAAAALKKAAADKEADEAFRKAAEADAERDKNSKDGNKKGWFGGWFKGKDPNAAPGPIRAKLGEESSFYYDPELKKWVNKKGGSSAAETPTSTPPPPKGPPTRNSSANLAAMAPPSGPPSRAMTPASMPPPSRPASGPPSAAGTPAMGSPAMTNTGAFPPMPPTGIPPSAPPSRPATSMSNASSIDDLLGAPAPRKGGTAKGKKRGGRYVDVMAK